VVVRGFRGQHCGHHIGVVIDHDLHTGDRRDRRGMQIVFQRSLARQNRETARSRMDRVHDRLSAFGLWRGFAIVEMKLDAAEWRQPSGPVREIAAANRQNDQASLCHVLGQIRDCGVCCSQNRREPCQEFAVVNSFDQQ
jgi:hypothetical protein